MWRYKYIWKYALSSESLYAYGMMLPQLTGFVYHVLFYYVMRVCAVWIYVLFMCSVCITLCVYAYMYVYMYVCMYMCVVCICIRMCRVCMCVCVCVCMCVLHR